MDTEEAGHWLMWGTGIPSAAVESLMRLAEAGPEIADKDPSDAHDCGEGELSDELDIDRYIALIRERDSQWTPPGGVNPDGTVSWLSVERNMNIGDIRCKAEARGARGFIGLDQQL